MEEWKTYKLGQIARVQTGPFGSQLHQSDYVDEGVPCIMPVNIGNGLSLLPDGIAKVTEDDANRLSKHRVNAGDIVYSRRGDIERCAFISKEQEGWLCGTGCLRVCDFVPGINPQFIAYCLSLPSTKAWLVSNAVGTTMLNLNTSILSDISLSIPDFDTQNKIVRIIDSFDSKIGINNRINHNLEEQAQALYKSCFVDFEPFKDGKFVESELGMIPEGWKVKALKDVTVEQRTRVGNKTDIKVLSPVNSGQLVLSEDYFTKQVYSESIAKYLIVEPNDFAYNPARINIGSIGQNKFEFPGCVSPVYVVFRCEEGYNHFFDLYRKTAAFKEEVTSRSIGGVRQTLGYQDLSLIKVIYPTRKVVETFNKVYTRMLLTKNHLLQEAESLKQTRDSLLPRLISGELTC